VLATLRLVTRMLTLLANSSPADSSDETMCDNGIYPTMMHRKELDHVDMLAARLPDP
jgi:hypothetical protein